MSEQCLELKNVCKSFRDFSLNNISFTLPQGYIMGLVGPNGAGKTTLIRLLCGLQKPTKGSFSLYGVAHDDAKIHDVRKRIGAVVETPSIYLDMSARDNLKEQYRILGLPSDDGINKLLHLVGLDQTEKKKAKNFSLGMRQRLGIAIALAGNPDFLVLDEPVNGLDPEGIIEIRELILKLNKEYQITILISSHILDELSRLATHYGFIDHGMIVKEISAKDLEAACRKCVRIQVSDTAILSRILDDMRMDYKILSTKEADIYGKINVTELTLKLLEEGCIIDRINEHDESLENYYINLVGGGRHE